MQYTHMGTTRKQSRTHQYGDNCKMAARKQPMYWQVQVLHTKI